MKNMKKILSFLLVLSMVLSYVPMPALAAEGGTCTHHIHDESCGYVEAVEGKDCTHQCSESCTMKDVTQCVHNHEAEGCIYTPAADMVPCDHVHDDSCNYNEAVDTCDHQHGACAYKEAVSESWSCGHICTKESGCVKAVCAHEHNADCGYVKAMEGRECSFVCQECKTEEEKVCTCGSTDPGEHAPFCNLYVRTYEDCLCRLSCAEEGLNEWCETCFFEGVASCTGGEEEQIVYVTSGVTGDCTWTFDDATGTLTISGPGDMGNNSSSMSVPWYSYRDKITQVIIKDGVTKIGNYAFYNCDSLVTVTIPDLVTSIGHSAFANCSCLLTVSIPASVTAIGGNAFRDCSSLTTVAYEGITVPSAGSHVFKNTYVIVEVPAGYEGDTFCGLPVTRNNPAESTTYTVTITTDGNGTASADPTSAAAGTEVTLTATPSSGCIFKEWQVISGGVTITDDTFTMPTSNVEVKAVFEAIPASDVEAKWGSSADSLTESGTLQEAIAAAVTGNAAYIQLQKSVTAASTLTISGGNFTIDLNGKEVRCSSDVFKLSTTTKDRVDVTICGNGKVTSSSGSAVNVSAYSIGEGIYVTLENGSYSGATGLSLTTKKSNATVCAGVSISNTNSWYPAISVKGGNLALNSNNITGKTAAIEYAGEATIDLRDCANPSGLTINAKMAMPIANVTLPSGYACYNGDVQYAADATVAQNAIATVKAVASTYTVTFDANGGDGTMEAQKFTSGVAQPLTENAFSREDYTFTGWNTKADGTGDFYADKANVTISADTILYAQWEAVKAKYPVTVTAGTGTGEYAEGDPVTITANAPADGKAFALWSGLDNITITEGSVTSETLTFTMPAHSVTVEATYIDAVASVTVDENTTNYATLEAAIAAAVDAAGGVEVKLLQSVSLNTPIAVHGGNFTLNLNENTYTNSLTAFNLNGDAKMTITGNGSITSAVHAIDLDKNAEVVLVSSTITGGTYAVNLRSGTNKLTVGANVSLRCNNQFGAPIQSAGTLIVTDDNLTGGGEDIRYDGGTVTLYGAPDGMTLMVHLSNVSMPISSLTLPDGYHAFNSNKEILESTETVGLNELVTIGKVADAATPSITAQPVGAEYALNATAEALSVTASVTDGGTLSYQWYSNTANSNQGGTAINGATSSTYTPATNQGGTVYYYCVVTNTNNDAVFDKTASVTSNAAAIKVHSHEWAYRLKENTTDTIEAFCKNTDGGHDGTNGGNVKISAAGGEYNGTSYTAQTIVHEDWKGEAVTIVYEYKQAENGTYAAVTEQKNAGFYKASITVDDVTAYITYEVTPKVLTIREITAADRVYAPDNTEVSVNLVLDGIIVTDNITVTATGTLADANAGTDKTVSVAITLSGDDARNYNCPATATTKVTIQPRSLNAAGITATLSDNLIFEGAAIPTLTVKDGTTTLTKDTDYTVTQTGSEGLFTLTITGKGNYKDAYGGTLTYLVVTLPDPDKVTPDDKAAIDAYDRYNRLNETYKDAELTKALEKLHKALTDYDIIKGHKSNYVKGSYKKLSFTANGYFGKFTGVEVDGKLIDKKYYTAESGSTIITLKTSYLESLKTGKHTIQVNYTDGNTGGEEYFRISVNNGSPFTGDNSHMLLFTGIAMTSLLCMAALVLNKKKFYQR